MLIFSFGYVRNKISGNRTKNKNRKPELTDIILYMQKKYIKKKYKTVIKK